MIVAGTADEDVLALVIDQHVAAGVAVQQVVAGTAAQQVVVGAGQQEVVAAATEQQVGPAAGIEDVVHVLFGVAHFHGLAGVTIVFRTLIGVEIVAEIILRIGGRSAVGVFAKAGIVVIGEAGGLHVGGGPVLAGIGVDPVAGGVLVKHPGEDAVGVDGPVVEGIAELNQVLPIAFGEGVGQVLQVDTQLVGVQLHVEDLAVEGFRIAEDVGAVGIDDQAGDRLGNFVVGNPLGARNTGFTGEEAVDLEGAEDRVVIEQGNTGQLVGVIAEGPGLGAVEESDQQGFRIFTVKDGENVDEDRIAAIVFQVRGNFVEHHVAVRRNIDVRHQEFGGLLVVPVPFVVIVIGAGQPHGGKFGGLGFAGGIVQLDEVQVAGVEFNLPFSLARQLLQDEEVLFDNLVRQFLEIDGVQADFVDQQFGDVQLRRRRNPWRALDEAEVQFRLAQKVDRAQSVADILGDEAAEGRITPRTVLGAGRRRHLAGIKASNGSDKLIPIDHHSIGQGQGRGQNEIVLQHHRAAVRIGNDKAAAVLAESGRRLGLGQADNFIGLAGIHRNGPGLPGTGRGHPHRATGRTTGLRQLGVFRRAADRLSTRCLACFAAGGVGNLGAVERGAVGHESLLFIVFFPIWERFIPNSENEYYCRGIKKRRKPELFWLSPEYQQYISPSAPRSASPKWGKRRKIILKFN